MNKLIEDTHYYDNEYTVTNDILNFERVYMVDGLKFDNKTYKALKKAYRSLPTYLPNTNSLPCWYGNPEKGDEYFITASFEPSGLQFFGQIPLEDFIQWETKLNELIKDFPFKYEE